MNEQRRAIERFAQPLGPRQLSDGETRQAPARLVGEPTVRHSSAQQIGEGEIPFGIGVAWIAANRVFEVGHGVVQPAQVFECRSQIDACTDMRGVEGQGFVQDGEGRFAPAGRAIGVAQIESNLGALRLKRGRMREARDGLAEIAGRLVSQLQIRPDGGRLGFLGKGGAVKRARIVGLAHGARHIAERRQRIRPTGRALDGSGQRTGRIGEAAGLLMAHTFLIKRVRVQAACGVHLYWALSVLERVNLEGRPLSSG